MSALFEKVSQVSSLIGWDISKGGKEIFGFMNENLLSKVPFVGKLIHAWNLHSTQFALTDGI